MDVSLDGAAVGQRSMDVALFRLTTPQASEMVCNSRLAISAITGKGAEGQLNHTELSCRHYKVGDPDKSRYGEVPLRTVSDHHDGARHVMGDDSLGELGAVCYTTRGVTLVGVGKQRSRWRAQGRYLRTRP
jgi:hypothetical protein